KIGVLPE
ncbi:UBN2 domain-containing protein, partial [Cephalotus follicularis]